MIEPDMVVGLQSMFSRLQPSLSSAIPSHSLEFLSVSLTIRRFTFHVACFYRPPSFSDLLSLTNLLLSLGPSFSSKLILVGDFNVNKSSVQLNTQLSSLMSLLSLTQHDRPHSLLSFWNPCYLRFGPYSTNLCNL